MTLRRLTAIWRQVARGARALIHRRAVDQDASDEIRDYLERATTSFVAGGMTRADAERTARLELGNETVATEQVRAYGWENSVETFVADVRYGLRRLRSSPVLTATVTVTLAIGIGATTAIFSAVNPILFEPLPYPNADRLVTILETRSDGARSDGTFGMFRELVTRSRSLESAAAFKAWQPAITGSGQPERLDGQRVSASYFHVLGVTPALGRAFRSEDDRPGQPLVAVMSNALWHRRFAGDRSIIGKQITLDDARYTVIGILPSGFENVLSSTAQVWITLQYDMSQSRAWGHHLRIVGRLRAGVKPVAASRELDAIAHAVLAEQHPETYGRETVIRVESLQSEVTRAVRPALLALLAAVVLVLAIACMNVTNLLVAQGVRRRGELALRATLGATRSRLSRQLLTENLLLALAGGALAMLVAVAGVRALVRLAPVELPRAGSIAISSTVFAFGFSITATIGVALGLILARQQTRSTSHRAFGEAAPRMTSATRRARRVIVVAEVALAFVLLVSSGLLLRSLGRLFAVSPGFDSSNLVTMQIQTSSVRFPTPTATTQFFEEALAAARAVQGVEDASLTNQLPISGDLDEYGVHLEWRPESEGTSAFRYAVTPGYIESMRIPVRIGRSIASTDGAGSPLVALVSESFAKHALAGVDPIGKRVRIGPATGPLYTIVGVVGDVRQQSLALTAAEAIYVPESQWQFGDNTMSLVVKTKAPIASIAPLLRHAIWSIDKDQPIVRVMTMRDLVATSAAERRFALVIFTAFAIAALILSAAGLYGVLSGSVAERTREIGVRSALGATRAELRKLVLGEGMLMASIGSGIGFASAIATGKAMTSLLFGVTARDPVTYLAVGALLLAVSAAACWIPAWRASRVDPAITLRATANG